MCRGASQSEPAQQEGQLREEGGARATDSTAPKYKKASSDHILLKLPKLLPPWGVGQHQ